MKLQDPSTGLASWERATWAGHAEPRLSLTARPGLGLSLIGFLVLDDTVLL